MTYTGEEIVRGVIIAVIVILTATVVLGLLFGIGGVYLIERIKRKRNRIRRKDTDEK